MARSFFGSKGSGGGASEFRQRPDTLRSNDIFEGLLGICAGPIKGLTNGLKSLKLNGTPVEDGAGTLNFKDMVVSLKTGDPALHPQEILLNLGAGGVPTSVGLTVANPDVTGSVPGDWVVKTMTNLGVDFIDLRFVVQQLYTQDKTGIGEVTANLEIQMKPSGLTTWINPNLNVPSSTYTPVGIDTGEGIVYLPKERFAGDNTWLPESNSGYLAITGKTTSPYVKELRIMVPNTGSYASVSWDVRVRLREPESIDADPVFTKRNISWETISGGYSGSMGTAEGWRGLSSLQVYGKATDEFNGVPTFEGEYDTKLVSVPPVGVYNPTARTYTGTLWDGSFSKAFTTDPAWIINDVLTDSIFGMSSIAPGSYLNKWDALEVSKWCSEAVSDGDAGTHPRYSLNFRSQAPQKANEFIQYLAGAIGGFAWDNGNGEWRIKLDKPEAPSDIVTLETIESEFSYSHTDVSTRYNDITMTFLNAEMGYREDRVRVTDDPAIALYGRKPTTLVAIGCTNRQEALRRATLRLRANRYETKTVSYSTNRRGRLLTPFSTILIADGDLGYSLPTGATTSADADVYNNRTTGRVVSTNLARTEITLRDSVRLELGVTYTLHYSITNPDYNPEATTEPTSSTWDQPMLAQTCTIVNTSGQCGDVNTLYLGSALPASIPALLAVAIEATGLPTIPKMYRVLSVSVDEQNPERTVVTAIEVDTGKWAAADAPAASVLSYSTPTSIVPPPLAPSSGPVLGITQIPGTISDILNLVVSWQRPASRFLAGFRVQYRLNDGPLVTAADGLQDTNFEFVNPGEGYYVVEICSRDRRGNYSAPLVSTSVHVTNTYVPGIVGLLSNENHSVATAADGSGGVYTSAGGTFQVFSGLNDVTADCTFAASGATGGLSASINAATGVYTVTDLTSDTGTVAFQATYGTVVVEKVYSISKNKSGTLGTSGLDAKTFQLSTNSTVVKYDTAGTLIASQTVTMTGLKQNTTQPIIVKLYRLNSGGTTTQLDAGVYLTGSGTVTDNTPDANSFSQTDTTVTLTGTNFNTAVSTGLGLLIEATCDSIVDKVSVLKLQDGAAGSAGSAGVNNAVITLYRRLATSPAAPSGTFTYTFATGVLSGGTLNSWTQAVPAADGNPLWSISATASAATATDSVPAAEFSTPITSAGAGLNTAPVYLYQRAASTPSVPAGSTTYTFATGVLSGTLGSWTQSASAGSNPLYRIEALASSTATTDTVLTTDWSTPIILVQDGAAGSAGTAAVSMVVTKKAVMVPSYSDGTVTDFANAIGQVTVYSGGTDVTASATLSAIGVGLTGTVNTATGTPVAAQPKGYYRVTAMSADVGTLTITAVYGGVTLTEVFSVSKAKGGYEIVATLPAANLFEGRIVYLTTDDKLYRYTGSAWISAVAAVDITGTITTTQITDDAITSPKIAANAVTATEIAANAVTATAIATDAVTANKIQAGAVTAAKISVTQLDAINATIGVLRTATTGARSEIRDNVIKVYDASNVLRVKIGDLSL